MIAKGTRLNVFPFDAFDVGRCTKFIYECFIIHLKCPEENKNVSLCVSTMLRSEKKQIGSLVMKAEPTPTRTAYNAQLNNRHNAKTDEQMLRIEIDVGLYCLNKSLNLV